MSAAAPSLPPRPSRRFTRRVTVAVLVHCAVLTLYLAIAGRDSMLSRTLADGAFWLAAGTVGAYVLGGSADLFSLTRRPPGGAP